MNMNFSAWAIRNPVIPILMFTVLVFLGIFGFRTLAITRFPNIDVPVITITVNDSGSAPSELETQITKKVEDTVASISGVKHVSSTITDGQSTTGVEFNIGIETDRALNDVKDAVSKIRGDLPSSIDEPIIQRLDVEGAAILTYAISSPGRTMEQLSWFVDDTIIRELQTVKGVGRVERIGGVTREIQVLLDPMRLSALGITAADVSNQLKSMNGDMSGGRGTVSGQEQTIRALAAAGTVKGLSNTVIVLPRGRNIMLSDLGTVVDSYKEPASFARSNGDEAVAVNVYRTKGESDWSVSRLVNKRIAELGQRYPDVSANLVDESVTYTYGNYSSAMETLFEGAALAVIVVLLFLRDLRATIIACVALPLAAIPTFWAIGMMGFSLNLVSLLAITLVTGILVDDAIVEIENISRHIHMGKKPYRASIEAADEIGMAVIAITFTIIAIFAPVSFMGGIAGQYFKQFGLTVACAVFFSLLVARLITPMMAAYLMRSPYLGDGSDGRPVYRGHLVSFRRYLLPLAVFGLVAVAALVGLEDAGQLPLALAGPISRYSLVEIITGAVGIVLFLAVVLTWLNAPHPENHEQGMLSRVYTAILRGTIYRLEFSIGKRRANGTRRRFAIPVGPFATVAAGIFLFVGAMSVVKYLPTGFLPVVDASRIVSSIELPPGARLEDTDRVTQDIVSKIRNHPEIKDVVKDVLVLGGTSPSGTLEYRRATIVTNLVRKDHRSISQVFVEGKIDEILRNVPDVRNYFVNDRGDRPYQVGVQSSNPDSLNATVAAIESDMRRRTDVFSNPSANANYLRPEIQIRPKKAEAADLGIATDAIASTVRVATIGNVDALLPKFNDNGRQIPIRVELDTRWRQDLSVISALRVNTSAGAAVPLAAVASVSYGQGPATITRFDRYRQVKIGSSLAPGKEVSDAERALHELPSVKNMPPDVHLAATGDTEAQAEIFSGFATAMASGIMMVFVLLILLLGNVFQPVTILAPLPLSIVGVVAALYFCNYSISMSVVIGILMLMGIVTKNAIMLVDFAVERVKHGMSRMDAVVEAGRMRSRPIIMTTIAMAAGMMPAAMASGEGGEFRAPMAMAVIGGLLASTALSLLFIPAVYTLMDDLGKVTASVFKMIARPNPPDEDELVMHEALGDSVEGEGRGKSQAHHYPSSGHSSAARAHASGPSAPKGKGTVVLEAANDARQSLPNAAE